MTALYLSLTVCWAMCSGLPVGPCHGLWQPGGWRLWADVLEPCLHSKPSSAAGQPGELRHVTHPLSASVSSFGTWNKYRVDKRRFTAVSMCNSLFLDCDLLIIVLVSMNNRKPTFAYPCNNIYFIPLLWWLQESVHLKCVAWCLACDKHSICGWYWCYYPYTLDEETEAWRVKHAERHSELWEFSSQVAWFQSPSS